MHAANLHKIIILGAAILVIKGSTMIGEILTTKQIVYVTDESDKFFLSRQGCIDLGMISDSFPTVGEIKRKLKAPEYATALEQIKQPASAMTSNCS